MLLLSSADFFKIFFLEHVLSNGLDPDQDQQNVGPGLHPNCLQRLSADDNNRCEQGKNIHGFLFGVLNFEQGYQHSACF